VALAAGLIDVADGCLVVEVLDEYDLEVAAAQDEKPMEALSTYGADEAFGDGVRARVPDRGLDDSDAFRDEDGVEGEGELGVAVDGFDPSLVTSAVIPRSDALDVLADPPMKLVIDCSR